MGQFSMEIMLHPPGSLPHGNLQAPRTTLAAKFSIQHIAAATLATQGAAAEAFHANTLTDPFISALHGKVVLGKFEPVLPSPNDRPARVVITRTDGTILTGTCLSARGGQDRPFTRKEIIEKGRATIEAVYPDAPERLIPLIDSANEGLRWGDLIRTIVK